MTSTKYLGAALVSHGAPPCRDDTTRPVRSLKARRAGIFEGANHHHHGKNIMNEAGTIVPKLQPIEHSEAKRLLAAGLFRTISKRGKRGVESVAIEADCHPKTLTKALAMETLPAGDTLLNLLLADVTALDELMARVGCKVSPLHANADADLDVVEALGALCGALAKSRSPNSPGGVERVHCETLVIADLARSLLPTLTAIVREADGIRGVA